MAGTCVVPASMASGIKRVGFSITTPYTSFSPYATADPLDRGRGSVSWAVLIKKRFGRCSLSRLSACQRRSRMLYTCSPTSPSPNSRNRRACAVTLRRLSSRKTLRGFNCSLKNAIALAVATAGAALCDLQQELCLHSVASCIYMFTVKTMLRVSLFYTVAVLLFLFSASQGIAARQTQGQTTTNSSKKSGSVKAPTAQDIADAKSKNLVCVNTTTRVYHGASSSFYGATRRGKFMTEDDAKKAGYRAASESASGNKKASPATR